MALDELVISCPHALQPVLSGLDSGFKRIHAFNGGIKGCADVEDAARSVTSSIIYSYPHPLGSASRSLDQYCLTLGLSSLSYLYIEQAGSSVLDGCRVLLNKQKVDYIELAGITSDPEITNYLSCRGYQAFHLVSGAWSEGIGPDNRALFVSERFQAGLKGREGKYSIQDIMAKHLIRPRGAIVAGGHDISLLSQLKEMGAQKVIWIEPNPISYAGLQESINSVKEVEVITVNCGLTEEIQVEENRPHGIESLTLDQIVNEACAHTEFRFRPEDFNLLFIKSRDADLKVLKGALQLMNHLDAVEAEIQPGAAGAYANADHFLGERGLKRAAGYCFRHHSFGDYLYLRKPKISMSSLGRNGRFANQLFQYAFVRICAQEHSLDLELPEWIGEKLFNCPVKRLSTALPEKRYAPPEAMRPDGYDAAAGFDHWGYYQFQTRNYAPFKGFIRSLFVPTPSIQSRLEGLVKDIRKSGGTLVALHLRRGDFETDKDFWCAPSEWYAEWLRGIWKSLNNPVLFLASDEPEKVLKDFKEYDPVHIENGAQYVPEAPFYPDFYLLSQADIVAVSNSSFSFFACLLNEKGRWFFRPHKEEKKLVVFDPWDAEVLWR